MKIGALLKLIWTKTSFETAKSSLNKVEDKLQRSMLWQSLWDSVKDGVVPVNEYLDTAIANIGDETDYTILGQVLRQVAAAKSLLLRIYPDGNDYMTNLHSQLEELSWQETLSSDNNKAMKRRWFGYYRSFATSDTALKNLTALLSGEQNIPDVKISQDIRWSIIARLNRFNYAGSLGLIEKELTNDNSDTGQKVSTSSRSCSS